MGTAHAGGVDDAAFWRCFPPWYQNGATVVPEATVPVFFDICFGKEEFSVCPIQNVKHSITIGLRDQLAHVAVDDAVCKYQIFVGIQSCVSPGVNW